MRYAMILALFGATTLFAAQPLQPSDASVNELLHYIQVDKMLSAALVQMTDGLSKAMEAKLQSTVGSRELTTAQKAAVDKFRSRFNKTLRDDLSLTQVRAIYLQCYKDTFTQDEVEAITAFYKTPAGQAMAERSPQVIQKAQALMQAKIQPMTEKVQAELDDMIRELENAEPAQKAPVQKAQKP